MTVVNASLKSWNGVSELPVLFAFVKSKSTDPGLVVIVEFTKTEDAASPKLNAQTDQVH